MDDARPADKQKRLEERLRRCGRLLVAFSGGVDSTFLLAVARRVLGEGVVAATCTSALLPRRERHAAAALARELGVEHLELATGQMQLPAFRANTPERCYICKRHVLGALLAAAAERGIEHVADGANTDDTLDHRPGRRAARELGVHSPLAEAGLGKAEIRRLSRQMGLATWDKPSFACLASRMPYGTPITRNGLSMVEAAEDFLLSLGIAGCRVRHHGQVARIEAAAQDLEKLAVSGRRERVVERLQAIGFAHVALDLEGYRQGSLDRAIMDHAS